MERDPNLLKDEFRAPLTEAVQAVRERGYVLRPFGTRRHPAEQARLWRQSRSTHEVRNTITMLRRQGASYLAMVLEEVGPQYGRWTTNALPGQSWHQWLEACDLFVLENGIAIWHVDHPGYLALHEEGRKRGLFIPLPRRDPYHVQLRVGSPHHLFSWPQIDDCMQRWYGDQNP